VLHGSVARSDFRGGRENLSWYNGRHAVKAAHDYSERAETAPPIIPTSIVETMGGRRRVAPRDEGPPTNDGPSNCAINLRGFQIVRNLVQPALLQKPRPQALAPS
jgi:hypothetical protein